MKPANFLEALTIMSENHSNEIVINKSFGHGSNTGHSEKPTIHIKNCTGATINKLKDAGFSLSMDNGFLTVDDYAKP